jgi:hypothetical protein
VLWYEIVFSICAFVGESEYKLRPKNNGGKIIVSLSNAGIYRLGLFTLMSLFSSCLSVTFKCRACGHIFSEIVTPKAILKKKLSVKGLFVRSVARDETCKNTG